MECKPGQPCWIFGGKVNSMSNEMARSRSVSGLQIQPSNTKVRRSVPDALKRANEVGSPLWRAMRVFPLTAPYGLALQGLTYGLIVVDPLDRLEGGLID